MPIGESKRDAPIDARATTILGGAPLNGISRRAAGSRKQSERGRQQQNPHEHLSARCVALYGD
jgi:hypothetical protein